MQINLTIATKVQVSNCSNYKLYWDRFSANLTNHHIIRALEHTIYIIEEFLWLKQSFTNFDQGSLDIVKHICVYIYICVHFVGRDTEWLWGGGRESMRYLVEQAFPLRQCELQHLKHSSFSWYKDRKIHFNIKTNTF